MRVGRDRSMPKSIPALCVYLWRCALSRLHCSVCVCTSPNRTESRQVYIHAHTKSRLHTSKPRVAGGWPTPCIMYISPFACAPVFFIFLYIYLQHRTVFCSLRSQQTFRVSILACVTATQIEFAKHVPVACKMSRAKGCTHSLIFRALNFLAPILFSASQMKGKGWKNGAQRVFRRIYFYLECLN